MVFGLNESLIEFAVSQTNALYPAYQLDWKTYVVGSVLLKGYRESILLLENEEVFALLFIGSFSQLRPPFTIFLDKSQVQGLKVKQGMWHVKLRIRMKTAAFYKFRFRRHGAGKLVPRHAENLEALVQRLALDFGDRTNVRNRDRLSRKWMKVLGALTMFGIPCSVFYVTESINVFTVVMTLMTACCFWVGHRWERMFAQRKDKAYLAELEQVKQLSAGADMETDYQALREMTNKPVTEYFQGAYYRVLVEGAHILGHNEEAKQYLELFPRAYSVEAEAIYQELLNALQRPVRDGFTDRQQSIQQLGGN